MFGVRKGVQGFSDVGLRVTEGSSVAKDGSEILQVQAAYHNGFLGNPPRPQVTYCTLAGTHIPVVPLSTIDSLSTCTIGSLFHGRLSQNGRKYIISYPHRGSETAERVGRQIRTETLAATCKLHMFKLPQHRSSEKYTENTGGLR